MNVIQHYFPEIRECVEDYCINLNTAPLTSNKNFLYTHAILEHKKQFLDLLLTIDEEEMLTKTKRLINYTIEHEIPYMFIYGELVTVARKLLGMLVEKRDFDHIEEVNRYFAQHETNIISLYLKKFLEQFRVKTELRLSHIATMGDKKLMAYYEHHLIWVLRLIDFIQNQTDEQNHPELRPTHCDFGMWLHNTTTPYLITTTHFKEVERLHLNLHDLSSNIVTYSQKTDLRPSTLIHLVQRIDYISLEIGNEIAILNEIEVSSKDPLTELLTRRMFDRIIAGQLTLAEVAGREFSVMMCDLDHFKKINDTYGHLAGDAILRNFASILHRVLRKSDYIFRFGGEEFIILLPSTEEVDARALAQKICHTTASEKVLFDEKLIRYTVSIGVISTHLHNTYNALEENTKDLLAQVDAKLYLAKQNGRNRVE